VRRLAGDTDLVGRLPVAVLTVKRIGPRPPSSSWTPASGRPWRGGSADRLVQACTRHDTHGDRSDVTCAALMHALLDRVAHGRKPVPADIAAWCRTLEADHGAAYTPSPLETRVPPRGRP